MSNNEKSKTEYDQSFMRSLTQVQFYKNDELEKKIMLTEQEIDNSVSHALHNFMIENDLISKAIKGDCITRSYVESHNLLELLKSEKDNNFIDIARSVFNQSYDLYLNKVKIELDLIQVFFDAVLGKYPDLKNFEPKKFKISEQKVNEENEPNSKPPTNILDNYLVRSRYFSFSFSLLKIINLF